MHIQQHGAYLIELTKFPGIRPVSCYLVREEDGFALIDTGISGMQVAILDAAQQRGAPLARMEAQIAFTELLQRLEQPRLVVDPPPYRSSPVLRGPEQLLIEVEGVRKSLFGK